jgi:signal transduction histidine kinase
MFDLSPENMLFFTTRDAAPKTEERKADVVIDQRVESHTFTRTDNVEGKSGTFNLQLRTPREKGRMRTSMVAGTSGEPEPWRLRVQHVSGSIDTFVQGERNKSFLIGLGVYLLLVGGIVAILLSAMRSRAFARRQIDFVSSVSHEFRTPLAVIYTAGENLADGVAKEENQVSRYGELIKGEGKKLSAMVEQILEFAGANSGKQKYRFSSTDVHEVVKDALNECRPLIDSGGFDVETDVQTDLPSVNADRSCSLECDSKSDRELDQIRQWFEVDSHHGEERRRENKDRSRGQRHRDRRADLRQIFEPFYRSKEVVDAQISGNGLGLNLVKKIVEAHDGSISVESTPGVGSTFTIELPQQHTN